MNAIITIITGVVVALALAVGVYNNTGTLAFFTATGSDTGAVTAGEVEFDCDDDGEGDDEGCEDHSHCTTVNLAPARDIDWGLGSAETCDTPVNNVSSMATALYLQFEYTPLPDDGSCPACNNGANLLASDFTMTWLKFAGVGLLSAGKPFAGAVSFADLVAVGCTKIAELPRRVGGTLSMDATLNDVGNDRQADSGTIGTFFLLQNRGAPAPDVCHDDDDHDDDDDD